MKPNCVTGGSILHLLQSLFVVYSSHQQQWHPRVFKESVIKVYEQDDIEHKDLMKTVKHWLRNKWDALIGNWKLICWISYIT